MQEQASNTVSFCPSFSTYYSSDNHLADIAAKVTEEELEQGSEDTFTCPSNQNDDVEEISSSTDKDEKDIDDFEFVLVRAKPQGNETAFPIFPMFNRDLLSDNQSNDREEVEEDHDDDDDHVIRLPLKELFITDRDPPSSSSSSEVDELEGVSPGTYCVWTPSTPSPSPARCKKSNSTGSSTKQQHQRWRLRDLLHLKRSHSDGKESFIFLNANNNNNNNNNNSKKTKEKGTTAKVTGRVKEKGVVSAHEMFYVRNKALKEGDKRKSYLPYRQGLVGFFANVNGLGRTFP